MSLKAIKKQDWSRRLITIIIVLPIFLAILLSKSPWVFPAFISLTTVLLMHEWLTITHGRGGWVTLFSWLLGLSVLPTWLLLPALNMTFFVIFLSVFSLVSFVFLSHPKSLSSCERMWVSCLAALAILNFSWAMITLKMLSTSLLLTVLVMLWLLDSGAYVGGRCFGKRPLMPAVSPKKTWEGWYTGLVITLAFGCLISNSVNTGFSIRLWWTLCVPTIILAGTWGDLYESWFKRCFDCKDSGKWLPGHGGLLDRVDSWVLTVPLITSLYVYYGQ